MRLASWPLSVCTGVGVLKKIPGVMACMQLSIRDRFSSIAEAKLAIRFHLALRFTTNRPRDRRGPS